MYISWEVWGEYFGYPDCCIKAFTRLEHLGQPSRKFHGIGFIPCPRCNQLSEEDILAKIAERRKCDRPSPGNVPHYFLKDFELDVKLITELGLTGNSDIESS